MLAQASDLDLAVAELDTAESFLDFFKVKYDPGFLISRRIKYMRLFQRQLAGMTTPYTWDTYYKAANRAWCELESGESVEFAESKCASCKTSDSCK